MSPTGWLVSWPRSPARRPHPSWRPYAAVTVSTPSRSGCWPGGCGPLPPARARPPAAGRERRGPRGAPRENAAAAPPRAAAGRGGEGGGGGEARPGRGFSAAPPPRGAAGATNPPPPAAPPPRARHDRQFAELLAAGTAAEAQPG